MEDVIDGEDNNDQATSASDDNDNWSDLECLLASHLAPPPTEHEVMEEVHTDYVQTRDLSSVSATELAARNALMREESSTHYSSDDDDSDDDEFPGHFDFDYEYDFDGSRQMTLDREGQ